MIYRPEFNLRMWDTWMFREKDEYHLFTLTQPYSKSGWDRVCHAVTTDWLHWRDCNDIVLQDTRNKDAWDAGCILTGSVFRTPDGYGMTYGSSHEGLEKIGLLFSKDLNNWEKCVSNPVMCPQGSFYEKTMNETAQSKVPWRDAYVIPGEQGYEAFVCAGDMQKEKTRNGCIARVTSDDLINWTYHPPIASPESYVDMEVPQYFTWNGFHYLLFSTTGIYTRIHLSNRKRPAGTFYLVSKEKYGEYQIPDNNMLIGSGSGRFDCYVGKVIEDDDGWLLYHHICGYRTAFASPKKLRQNSDGTLYLERWKGLDGLLGKPELSIDSKGTVLKASKRWPIGSWRQEGNALFAEAGKSMTCCLFDKELTDFSCSCRIDLSQSERAGIVFRINEIDTQSEKGWAISLDRRYSRIELCRPVLQCRTSLRVDPLDAVSMPVSDQNNVEIFVRDSYVEIYCNGCPLFVFNSSMVTASDHVTSGRLGLFAENGSAVFDRFKAHTLPELK